MSAMTTLADVFMLPANARRVIVRDFELVDVKVPTSGSSFFIHLSELCPVACEHCMYASDLNAKSAKADHR